MSVEKGRNKPLKRNKLFWKTSLTIFLGSFIFLLVNEMVLLFVESTFTETFNPEFFSYFLIEPVFWGLFNFGKSFIIFIAFADLLAVVAVILCIISLFVDKSKMSLRRIATFFAILYFTITTIALIFFSPGFYMDVKFSEINVHTFYQSQGLNLYALILLFASCVRVISLLIVHFITKRFSIKLINGLFLAFFAIIAKMIPLLQYRSYIYQVGSEPFNHPTDSFTFLSNDVEFILYLIVGAGLITIAVMEELAKRRVIILKTNLISTISIGLLIVIITAIYSIVHFSTGIHFLSTGNALYSIAKILMIIGFITNVISAVLYLSKVHVEATKTITNQEDDFIIDDESFGSLSQQKNNKTKKKLPVDIEEELKKEELFKKGLLLAEKGRFRRAIAVWKALVDLEPSNYIVLNNIGLAFKELGRLLTAMNYWEQALEIQPNYIEAKNNLDIAREIIRQKEKKKLIPKKEKTTNQE
jgi:hypothetical protein